MVPAIYTISPAKLSGPMAEKDHQLKAAMAFSALVNTLVIALVTLLPGASLSLAVIILAASGLSSTAGLIILLLRDTGLRVRLDKLILPGVLLLLYSLQLAIGIELGGAPGTAGNLSSLGGLCIGFFGFAIARAWALVGARNSSLLAAVVEMAGRPGDPEAIAAHGRGAGRGAVARRTVARRTVGGAQGEAGEAAAPPDRGHRD